MATTIDLSNLPLVTNKIYYPLYTNKSRYLVLIGGGGSGKSHFTAQKIVFRMLVEEGHRILVVRKVAKTLRESVFALLRGVISDWGMRQLFEYNKTDMTIKCKNGNEILMAGLDDVEKLKSIYNITSIWIEESSELEPEDYRQLDIRLRGETKNYKQIMFSFNPVSITHWLKSEFFDVTKPDTTTLHTTYKHNRFLDRESIKVLESFRETDPYYYQVYCLGEWGVLGKTIFDAQKVTDRIYQLRSQKPVKVGYFLFEEKYGLIVDDTIQFIEDDTGYINIFAEKEDRRPYVLGGDTSGEGSDYFVGQVIDNVSGKQVATLRHQFDEDLYAKQMYCLGKYYSEALIAIETNYSTHPVKELERLGYSRQYVRELEDTFTGGIKKAYGFQTTKITRPLVIAELVSIVREQTSLFNDMTTLDEMLTFVRNEKGKPEAQEGKHDDCIMAIAIAYHARSQQSYLVEEKDRYYECEEEDEESGIGGWYD
jgi:phage terminase large subunit